MWRRLGHVIDCLQPIPRESNGKDMVAMLGELTIEANEESFVIVLQHGGNVVTWKRSIITQIDLNCLVVMIPNNFPDNAVADIIELTFEECVVSYTLHAACIAVQRVPPLLDIHPQMSTVNKQPIRD